MRILKPTTPRVIYASYGRQGISPSQRHIGKYYWCNYWHHWEKVLRVDVDGYQVEVMKCDDNGNPIGASHLHCTAMDPAMFADHPFEITRD